MLLHRPKHRLMKNPVKMDTFNNNNIYLFFHRILQRLQLFLHLNIDVSRKIHLKPFPPLYTYQIALEI